MDPTTLTDDDLDALRVAVLTEQERRQRIATATALVESLTTQYEDAVADAPATPWADLTDRVGPGQRVVWTDGETYRNISRAWLNTNDTPAAYPQGWAQETGLPAEVAPFVVGESVKVGNLRTYKGIVYRVLQAHTTQADWTPPASPALWTPQG